MDKLCHLLPLAIAVLVAAPPALEAQTNASGATAVPQEVVAYPDLLLVNGKVLTVDEQFTIVEAAAVRDGRILAVGSTPDIRRLAGPQTKIIDLAGRSVVPGFDSNGDNAFAGGDLYKDTMINGKIGKQVRGESVPVMMKQVAARARVHRGR